MPNFQKLMDVCKICLVSIHSWNCNNYFVNNQNIFKEKMASWYYILWYTMYSDLNPIELAPGSWSYKCIWYLMSLGWKHWQNLKMVLKVSWYDVNDHWLFMTNNHIKGPRHNLSTGAWGQDRPLPLHPPTPKYLHFTEFFL